MDKKGLMKKLKDNLDKQTELYMSGNPEAQRLIDKIEQENKKLKKQIDGIKENKGEIQMNILEKIDNYLNEKTLGDADIKDMINTIKSKTKDKDDDGSKSMYKMADDMSGKEGLSPKQVGWLMKTMKALSGK